MKLYIATIALHNEDGISHERTFASKDRVILTAQVGAFLDTEGVPHDHFDIFHECSIGNEKGEPLSLGVDTDLCREYLLFTSIQEV